MNSFAAQLLRVVLLSSICAPAAADQCRFTSDRAANFTGTIKRVVLSVGAGHLKVTGNASDGVSAKGRACASSQALLSKITLESRRDADTVYLKVAIAESLGDRFSFSRYTSLDLDVSVPGNSQLDITDTSGDVELSDVGPSMVVDESGELLLKNINGDLVITDDAGELRASGVVGNVKVKDRAGNIDIEDVRGDVKILLDSAGGISIAKVLGSVEIVEDGAGDITVREVANDVIVGKDGSGDIYVSEVGGSFSVNVDDSGNILHDRVQGTASIPAKP